MTDIDTRLDTLMQNVHSELELMYPAYNREKVPVNLAKLIFESADVEEFCIPFEAAWQLAGHSRKDNAKRILTSKLRKNIDYKIIGFTEKNNGKRGGDRRGETITLTPDGFISFLLYSSASPRRDTIQRFVIKLLSKLKCLRDTFSSNKSLLEPTLKRTLSEYLTNEKRMENDLTTELSQQKKQKVSEHDDWKHRLATAFHGREEVVTISGGRCDVVTKRFAIEVKSSEKWRKALGQALSYADELGKDPAVFLFGPEVGNSVRYIFKKYNVTVFTPIDIETEVNHA